MNGKEIVRLLTSACVIQPPTMDVNRNVISRDVLEGDVSRPCKIRCEHKTAREQQATLTQTNEPEGRRGCYRILPNAKIRRLWI